MTPRYLVLLISCLTSMTSGCGGGSSSTSNPTVSGRTGTDETRITLKVTDAPIDGITNVWVQFSAIEIKPADGDAIRFDLASPRTIDLLSLTGTRSEALLDNEVVAAGDYEWVRLMVNAENGVQDSYVRLDNGSEPELEIPSGANTGLKLNRGFSAEAATPVHVTIDFDLRKSITVTGGGRYIMNPVLNLVEDKDTGSLSGTVAASLLTGTGCSDADPATGNAVYVYSGGDIVPDDIANSNTGPYTTTTISYNAESGDYEYEVGFLPEGEYTVAFTCAADDDELNSDDDIDFVILMNDVEVENEDDEDDNMFR